MKQWIIRILVGGLLLAGLCLVIGFAYLKWIGRHQPDWPDPHPDVDLTPSLPILTELSKDNGMYHIEALVQRWKLEELKSIRSPKEVRGAAQPFGEKIPDYDQFLSANPFVIDLFNQATDCDIWQAKSAVDIEGPFFHIFTVGLQHLLIYRMEQAAARGAWDEVADLFGRMQTMHQGTARGGCFVDHLSYVVLESFLLQELTLILAETDPPEATLSELEEQLRFARQNIPSFEEAIKHEWRMMSNAVERVLDGENFGMVVDLYTGTYVGAQELPALLSFFRLSQPQKTRQNMASMWSHLVHDMSRPYGSERFGDTWRAQSKCDNGLELAGASDPLGRFLAVTFFPNLSKARDLDYLTPVSYEAMLLQIALEREHQKTGRYPETLDRLSSSLPLDPSARGTAPIRYKKDGDTYQLYACGPNREDNGGAHWWNYDDAASSNDDVVFHPCRWMLRPATPEENELDAAPTIPISP